MTELHWQKSFFSEDQAKRLYLATAPDGAIRLRESDEPDTALSTTPARLSALLRHLKAPPLGGPPSMVRRHGIWSAPSCAPSREAAEQPRST
jgi:hypothetical protein